MTGPQGISSLDPALEFHIVNSLGWTALRPLQADAVGPVRSGADCLLLAPTAGGKTEAAAFPLLSEMIGQNWRGLSVLYVAPLRALLNNLYPRLTAYGSWVGRTVGLWHGDVGDADRRRMLTEQPDILLTTPESLEAMLVSRRVDHARFLGGVRAVIIDEVHSFAASDRGWHLLAVLERLQRLAGTRIQRVGLSATVGNPLDMVSWLQGSNRELGREPIVVQEAPAEDALAPDVTLDFVGSLANAAEVVSRIHRGEKRLVFCQSRKTVEELVYELRERGVTTYASHSSLSKDERAISERAFAESNDCVIVATSTLELGVDIGDLDRVIQIDAPYMVSSFLQRMGRTGRRIGTTRNTLFLTTDGDALLRAAALLHLWKRGFVEEVTPPPHPRHIAAQQFLALALQEGSFWRSSWPNWWAGSDVMLDGVQVLDYLCDESFLVSDGDRLFIGPRAEEEFGRRYFMDLLSSFIADKELRVLDERRELGSVEPLALKEAIVEGREPLLLTGRSWRVLEVDWKRFVVRVAAWPERGSVRWHSGAIAQSFEMMRAQRDVLLGVTPDVTVSRRATRQLGQLREELADTVDPDRLVRQRTEKWIRVWTWAGLHANATLLAALGEPLESDMENEYFSLPTTFDVGRLGSTDVEGAVPYISPQAVEALKFSAALPDALAVNTLAERFANRSGAAEVVGRLASGFAGA